VNELRDNNVRAIAKVLKRDPHWLRGENVPPEGLAGEQVDSFVPHPTDVPIVGIVESGAFRPEHAFEEMALGYLQNARDPNFPNDQQFAYIVRGDQMDRAGIADGDDIVCVDPWDIAVQMGDGDVVVIEVKGSTPAGPARELTVRELVVKPDQYEFVPRSGSRHHTIAVPLDADLMDGDTRIAGVVTSIIRRRPVKLGVRGALRAARTALQDRENESHRSSLAQKAAGLAMVFCFCWMASASVAHHHHDRLEHYHWADHKHTDA
jgi:SOS-response transcriptional repressor LexA